MNVRFRSLHKGLPAALLLAALSLVVPAQAADVNVSWVAADGTVVATRSMDLEALDGLEQGEIVTSTPWTSGRSTFSGPPLAVLANLEGGTPNRAVLRALNDFTAEVPSEDWTDHGIVLATRIDGKVPRVYEKGPYWLIYPVDSLGKPLEQKFVSRMIWQVDAVTFYLE
jgi:hypothetical protein